jgi:hypothetical protein
MQLGFLLWSRVSLWNPLLPTCRPGMVKDVGEVDGCLLGLRQVFGEGLTI